LTKRFSTIMLITRGGTMANDVFIKGLQFLGQGLK